MQPALPPNALDPAEAYLASIRMIVRQELAAFTFGPFEFVVVASYPNGTVDLQPADAQRGLAPLSGLRVWPGLPGAVVQPAVGSHLAVAFLDGRQGKPVVLGAFDPTSPTLIALNSGFGAAEHLTTIEGVANVLAKLGAVAVGAVGWTELQVAAAIGAAGSAGILPTTVAAIAAALAAKGSDPTGESPSVGCPNLKGG